MPSPMGAGIGAPGGRGAPCPPCGGAGAFAPMGAGMGAPCLGAFAGTGALAGTGAFAGAGAACGLDISEIAASILGAGAPGAG